MLSHAKSCSGKLALQVLLSCGVSLRHHKEGDYKGAVRIACGDDYID